ncbi:hypothetical protein Vi05172_g12735 [Venturia inaequalis]|nr:hypothetical protein Vi05172_g12735 [Venturia inaequalis]
MKATLGDSWRFIDALPQAPYILSLHPRDRLRLYRDITSPSRRFMKVIAPKTHPHKGGITQ